MTEVKTVVLRPHHADRIMVDVPNETIRRVFTKDGYHRDFIADYINLKNRVTKGEVIIEEGSIGSKDIICQLCLKLGAPHEGCRNWDSEFQKRLDTIE